MYDHEEYEDIPDRLLSALDEWGKYAHLPGQFLGAVLCNDLRDAVGRADPESMAALKKIVVYATCQLPGPCWGSLDNVIAWKGSET